jgi:hypothetical protein
MLTRFLYRVVALFFFLLAGACVLVAVGSLAAVIVAGRFDLIPMGAWAAFFAYMLSGSADRAWRMGRYDPLYD